MSEKPPILVAEDEAMLRVIAVEMLEEAGFKVFQAGDGVEALELLKSNPQIAIARPRIPPMPASTAASVSN